MGFNMWKEYKQHYIFILKISWKIAHAGSLYLSQKVDPCTGKGQKNCGVFSWAVKTIIAISDKSKFKLNTQDYTADPSTSSGTIQQANDETIPNCVVCRIKYPVYEIIWWYIFLRKTYTWYCDYLSIQIYFCTRISLFLFSFCPFSKSIV